VQPGAEAAGGPGEGDRERGAGAEREQRGAQSGRAAEHEADGQQGEFDAQRATRMLTRLSIRPSITNSKGPAPTSAATTPVIAAHTTRSPATSMGIRAASACTVGSASMIRLIDRPTMTPPKIVGRRGRRPSVQASTIAIAPVIHDAVPTLVPIAWPRPVFITSFGATPSLARTISATPNPTAAVDTR
jgi:hypothetical protein